MGILGNLGKVNSRDPNVTVALCLVIEFTLLGGSKGQRKEISTAPKRSLWLTYILRVSLMVS